MNKKTLEKVIKEAVVSVLNEQILNEWDPDEPDEDYYEPPEVSSTVTIPFNPQTLEVLNKRGVDEETDGWITVSSSDFPDAWSTYDSGDYWTPPESNGETGECGGDYEVCDWGLPEEYDDDDSIIEKFTQLHEKEIIEALTENAEFD